MPSILIADDSIDVLEAMELFLEELGHEIKTAHNKVGLFTHLTPAVPDLILLDTFLDGQKGKEICKEIKNNESGKNIPIILMSTNEKILNDYKECGAIDILTNPFYFSDLVNKIKSALKLKITD